jgi:hypothetical protein
MKKKIIIILLIIIALLAVFKFVPLGSTKYTIPDYSVTLEIPKLSTFKEVCCMFSASFSSFRSAFIIQKELDSIMSKYERMTCHNKTYYYDKKNDITISDYTVKHGLIKNTFFIIYNKGKYSDDNCNTITNPTQLKYVVDMRYAIDEVHTDYKYEDNNGNLHNVYIDRIGNLEIQNGSGHMQPLDTMLMYNWMTMDDLIAFLEYQVETKKATKEVCKDGGSILYKNKDFSLLKCNTLAGNKDVYIGHTSMKYEKNYCK